MDRFTMLRSLACLAVLAASPALAADKTEAVHFKAGATSATLKGNVKGNDVHTYTLAAAAGQVMQVLLSPSTSTCYFNVLPPGSEEAIFNGSSEGNEFGGTLGATGDYRAVVYVMGNQAPCSYEITFEISAK